TRRDTRFSRHWSSGVCSSDLHAQPLPATGAVTGVNGTEVARHGDRPRRNLGARRRTAGQLEAGMAAGEVYKTWCEPRESREIGRSEERRVGEENRGRVWMNGQ